MMGRSGFALIFAGAALIQVAALFHASGDFNSNNFGYRFIFGVQVFFLGGLAYGRRKELFYRRICHLYAAIYVTMLIAIAPSFGLYTNTHVIELLMSATLAAPLLNAALSVKNLRKRWRMADDLLGRLAYPIFICHFLVFFCCEKLLGLTPQQHVGVHVLTSILGSLVSAMLLIQLQAMVEHYRISGRGFASMCDAS